MDGSAHSSEDGNRNEAVGMIRRDRRHDDLTPIPRAWYADDPGLTAFFNAMSIAIEELEHFLLRSVRPFRDTVKGTPLEAALDDFLFQESTHSREHRRYNRQIDEQGFPAAALAGELRAKVARMEARRTPLENLALTAAIEHFTAILAHQLLDRPEHLRAHAYPPLVRLWIWHGAEEVEHKSVTFDLLARQVSGARRYMLRLKAILAATFLLLPFLYRVTWRFLKAEGLAWRPASWRLMLRVTLVYPGFMRRMLRDYLRWYRPGFHPWDQDDRALLFRWRDGEPEQGMR
ncbi:metal-dependent hydrolase [uncultured Parvibaculum sp.]|uniref:metal-dependent hydrolase n=1 Tax=uncultured Parvibaculum sp. TaxID=291828 RepID=UPI0030EE13F3|tara:strand:- start:33723 stop:34589 length:867 start_codon:yes stop_codon:yes gene_type:complete